MLLIHHPGYDYGRFLPLPRHVHGFVRDKPSRIRRGLIAAGVARAADFARPAAASDADVAAVHTADVVRGLRDRRAIAAAIEVGALALAPTALACHAIVRPQLRAAGGTAMALDAAATGAWALNTSGGFHHARPDRSHGFCLVNDVAIALHALNRRGSRPRVLVLDLDLHQGDGNAAAFADRADVFTASLHQQSAFPIPKLKSDVDVGLPDGADDDAYLSAVDGLLAQIGDAFEPEVVVYVAGTDPFVGDAIGALRVSVDGLVERDRRVARFTRDRGAGLVALPAGGYSPQSPDIAAAGFAVIAALAPRDG